MFFIKMLKYLGKIEEYATIELPKEKTTTLDPAGEKSWAENCLKVLYKDKRGQIIIYYRYEEFLAEGGDRKELFKELNNAGGLNKPDSEFEKFFTPNTGNLWKQVIENMSPII